jgi:hypothetical protein
MNELSEEEVKEFSITILESLLSLLKNKKYSENRKKYQASIDILFTIYLLRNKKMPDNSLNEKANYLYKKYSLSYDDFKCF